MSLLDGSDKIKLTLQEVHENFQPPSDDKKNPLLVLDTTLVDTEGNPLTQEGVKPNIVVHPEHRVDFDTKVIRDLAKRPELRNMSEFTRTRSHWRKHGEYTFAPKKSAPYKQFWEEERRRCLEGFSVGGLKITGDNYYYWNFIPILRVPDGVDRTQVKAIDKIADFPAFWYSDWEFYTELERARLNGRHFIVLKARGKGYSYKLAAWLTRNYMLLPYSKGFAFASEKEFLLKDGVLTKAWEQIDWLNGNDAWRKRSSMKATDMHRRASYRVKMDGTYVERGYRSEIMGVTFKDDPNKGRGKRGKRIIWEEFGKFAHAKDAWEIARPSVEQDGYLTGQMVAYGTGGEKGADFEAMQEMFYNPEAYNIQVFKNIWEEGAEQTCGYFVPAYLGRIMDKDGNDDIAAAKAGLEKARSQVADNTTDKSAVDKHIAENPFTPSEAMLNVSANIFPTELLKAQKYKVMSDKTLASAYVHGNLVKEGLNVKFKPSDLVRPIHKYPHGNIKDLTGCVSILEPPIKVKLPGAVAPAVPNDLYLIWLDPYAFDKTKKITNQTSLGAAYVYKRVHNLEGSKDILVGSYVGRPATQETFHQNLFLLAEYYNARIGMENDRGRGVIEYAKSHKLQRYLEQEFQSVTKKDGTSGNDFGRSFGVSMSNQAVKEQAEIFLRDWLVSPNGVDQYGNVVLNLHLIYDIALLDELMAFSRLGNFDRVSALLVGMWHKKEVVYQQVKDIREEDDEFDSFWNRDFYS